MSHPHTLCIGASRWRKHSLCREEKEGRGGQRRGGDGKGVVKGGEKRRSKAEWKEGVERVKIVEERDAAALYNCLHTNQSGHIP